MDLVPLSRKSKVVLARNEVDYLIPTEFDDILNIYIRVSMIGTTSFIFQGVIKNHETKKSVAENLAVHVWLHKDGGRPRKLPRDFIAGVEKFEGVTIPRKM